MDHAELARRIHDVARLEGRFTLRSGQVSDTYFDKYLFESDPVLLRGIGEAMTRLVPGGTEVLCGLELGGIPVVTVLSQLTGLPAAFIRKTPTAYGTQKYAEGPVLADKKLLVVEDVVSSGGQIIDSVSMMRDDGLEVDSALCVIDRRPDGSDALEAAGIRLESVFTMEEIESASQR